MANTVLTVIGWVGTVLVAIAVGRFAAMNRARVPPTLWARLEEATPADRLELAVEHATALCEELLAEGAPGLHLYTLNQSPAAQRIVANLGAL